MKVNVLIFNCGSSSLSSQVFEFDTKDASIPAKCVFSGKGHRVSTKSTEKPFIEYHIKDPKKDQNDEFDSLTHGISAEKMIHFLDANKIKIDFIGHRFVHSGGLFNESVCITDNPEVYQKLKGCLKYAPIHNPAAISVIDECTKFYEKKVKQFVVFDTSFHSKMKPSYFNYAIDKNLAEKNNYRKYGFHGLSYQYVTETLSKHLKKEKIKMVACHLGTGGASCTAIEDGNTVDTTMGWGTIPGLVMSTRCGDIDPGIITSLVRDLKMSPDEVDNFIATKCGNVGLTRGVTSDLRDAYAIGIDKKGNYDDKVREDCKVCFEVYVNRLVEKIGGLMAAMGGMEYLVFTDDLGFNMWQLRLEVCKRLEFLGVKLDEKVNQETAKGKGQLENSDVAEISDKSSKIKVYVVKNDEEIIIAREARKFFGK